MYKIPANTLFIGKNLVFRPECHSTNSLAAELLNGGDVPDGSIVITDNQTAGRGQRGSSWITNPGENLTFSIVLFPLFLKVTDQFYLTIVVSLSVCDFLQERLQADVKIKWPNDILVGGKKICGVLIENSLSGNKLQNSILGIGLNVNQTSFSIPSASSMYVSAQKSFNLNDEFQLLVQKLEARYIQLRAGHQLALKHDYLQQLHWKDELHTFETAGSLFKGTIRGVEESGKLIVVEPGRERTFDLKEVSFVE